MLRSKSVMVVGIGGQGVILGSHIIAEAVLESGYHATVAETYGGAMRGGSVYSLIRISKEPIHCPIIPSDTLDVLIGLEPLETLRYGVRYLSPDATVVTNEQPITPIDANIGIVEYPKVDEIMQSLKKLCKRVLCFDAHKLAEQAGSTKSLNVVMIGALAKEHLVPVTTERLKHKILMMVPKGTEQENLRAFELGYGVESS